MENIHTSNKRKKEQEEPMISDTELDVITKTKQENNIKIVRQALEALNTGDISRVHEFISPEYFNHESQMDPVRSKLRGPEEFTDTVKNLRSAFADLHYEEQETIASGGDKVISILNVTGKHVGNFFGIAPPTGHDISYEAVHIHRIGNDGKIVEHKAIRDDLKFMMQLGIVGPSSVQYEPLFQAWKGFTQSQTSHQLSTTSEPSPDEAAIHALYQQIIDGWNRGSGDAFAAPYTEDGDLVGFDGTHLKGRQEIASFHQQLFDTFLKGSRLVGKVRSVRFLTHDVALIHAVSGTIMAGQSDIDPERNSIQTLVAIKRGPEWRLAAFQNTRAQFLGRPDAFQTLTEELRQEL
jgi:uncharacterized protein (TIGR02246 family)